MMKNYNVPNDSLEQRMDTFVQLMTPDPVTGYMDGEVYQLIKPYVKERNLDQEQKFWLGILYSLSYSCTTAVRFFEEFPTIKGLNFTKLERFWDDSKSTLWYNPDKRYLKNNNQVIPAIRCIYELSNGNLTDYLMPKFEGGFDSIYKEIIKNWRFYGPMGAYLFFDTIYGWSREIYKDPSNIDWKGGSTVVEGMAMLLGEDDLIDTKKYDLEKYNKIVDGYVEEYGWTRNVIESNLCFFRKLFKATRYLGYYADRDLEECHATAEILQKDYGIDIWKYRELTVQDDLRGEIHGWTSVRKERLRHYLKTGKL